ncbi:PAS domain S-box protein [Microcoleus sp. FACHB-831]|uniref:PAS domain S-box protein n=1 Tax=Microcoleus sp. FACHB-831 TaxID=2692827 RepID=UPI0018EFB57E|nr:PAS domain S-box protein [Microcoleus sp. FACHB-831]
MKKPVIICVDDESTIVESLEIQLKKYCTNEYLIETASDGEEALELIEELLADEYEISLVIADCIMPKMQGDELLIRIHALTPETFKVMLTGQANIEAVVNAINGANLYRYLTKPWQDEDLKLTVQEALRSYFQDKQLAEQNAKLAEYNQNLEQVVKIRTEELEEKNRQVIASEKKYRDLVETSQDTIWSVDALGRYTFVNQAVKQMYGYEPVEMLGRRFADFMTPEQYAKDLEVFQQILEGEPLFQYETTHVAKDGRRIHLLFNAIALRDDEGNIIGTTGTASDITKRKQTQEALLASEKKYRALVEASQDIIWSVDALGRYTFVNQAVKQIYGYEPEEMLGRQFAEFEPPEQIIRDLETFKRLLEGESVVQYESTQLAKDGRQIYLMFNAIALRDDKGNVIGTTGTASDITKRKQTEEALRERESMLSQITNTMPGAVYQFMLTAQGQKKYPFISEGAYELLGYTAEQLMQDYALQWNQILLEDRERLEESVNTSAQQHQPWFEEFRINHTNGQVRWIQGHSLPGEPLPDGTLIWTGTLIDITDRKQREEALRLIVEGTASKTGDEFFRSCVRYLAKLLHIRYALVTEWADLAKTKLRTLAFWTGDDFGENFEYYIANTPCRNVIEGTTCYYPQSVQTLFPSYGNLVTLGAQSYIGIPLINTSGNILGHLAVMDIKPIVNASSSGGIPSEHLYILKIFAARTAAELERKLAEDALKRTAFAADAANRAKTEFLSRMSHELRTPLNAILGFTQVMNRNPSLPTEAHEQLGIISRSGEHLLELINDILQMAKIDSGKVTLNETSFDLYYMLEAFKEMFQLKAKIKGIKLIFDKTPDVPQYVQTDESKLRQILINLLENAIKFTEAGEVTLRLRVEQGSDRAPLRLLFQVEDTGSGIAPEEMHLLFKPFEQTETGRKSQQGTGLGLPLSQQFVQLMGGDITVSSTLGKGTIFQFYVPLCLAQSHEVSTPQETRRVIGLAPDQPKYRILIVDNVQSSCLLLVKMLTSVGFDVREASNGVEAIALWESYSPHLIFIDMVMPVMDGYEATCQIKAREQASRGAGEQGSLSLQNQKSKTENQKTVIIALTANAFEEERAVIMSAGCDDFASEPLQEETIFSKIAQHLEVRYIYEEPPAINLEVKPQDEESRSDRSVEVYLSQMPDEWVTQLYQAAAVGSDCQILQLIEQIPSTHAPLRHTLIDWVNDFLFERVIDLIKQVKE